MSKEKSKSIEHKTFEYQGNSYNGKNKVDIQILISSESEDDDVAGEKRSIRKN